MHRMGLNGAGFRAYLQTLRSPHDVRVDVDVYNLNSRRLLGQVELLGDAQVNMDADADAMFSFAPILLDRDRLIGRVGMDRQIQVTYRVRVPSLQTWASRVVFAGPAVLPPSRDGDEVTVSCQDRAAIALRGVRPQTYPRGDAISTIRRILSEKCGETRFSFASPKRRPRLEDPVTVGWREELSPWRQCQKIAHAIDMQLYYDGPVCTLRAHPAGVVDDLTGLVVRRVPSGPPDEIINRVKVVGKRPKDHTVVRDLPPRHDFSPQSLKVGGEPQFFTWTEENDKISTREAAAQRANRLLNRYESALAETRGFDIVPSAHYDPLDVVRTDNDRFRVRRWSLPVTASGEMTLGYNAPIRSKRNRKGRNR